MQKGDKVFIPDDPAENIRGGETTVSRILTNSQGERLVITKAAPNSAFPHSYFGRQQSNWSQKYEGQQAKKIVHQKTNSNGDD